MNLKTIITKVGTGIFRDFVPGGDAIIDVVNAVLPDHKKLSPDATGQDIRSAVDTLPPEQRAMVLTKEFDVEIAEINGWSRTQEAMAQVDIARASTRPQIAMMMAKVVAFAIIIVIAIWAVAVIRNNIETLKVLAESSMFLFTVLGTPTLLLRSYFGLRTKEKSEQTRVGTGTGPAPNPIAEVIGAWRAK